MLGSDEGMFGPFYCRKCGFLVTFSLSSLTASGSQMFPQTFKTTTTNKNYFETKSKEGLSKNFVHYIFSVITEIYHVIWKDLGITYLRGKRKTCTVCKSHLFFMTRAKQFHVNVQGISVLARDLQMFSGIISLVIT